MARYPELDLWDVPSYNAFYYLLRKLDPDVVARSLEGWFYHLEPQGRREVWAADGKVLRGSKRRGGKAYQAVEILVQGAKEVRALGWVPEGGGESPALVEMLWRLPVEGKLVTLDAGNMNRSVTQGVTKKGGLCRVDQTGPKGDPGGFAGFMGWKGASGPAAGCPGLGYPVGPPDRLVPLGASLDRGRAGVFC